MTTLHLVVGPDQHGVVRHGGEIATACGHESVRVRPGQAWPELHGADVVHVPFTDRLFAPDLDLAAARFRQLVDRIADRGAALSVTLHDVPHDDSPLQLRRRAVYRDVIRAARGVVVNSRLELSLIEPPPDSLYSLRVAPLPVLVPPQLPARPAASVAGTTVAVLGFVYPDRGYEDVLAAMPPDATLLALGRPSDGHDELAARYERAAAGRWAMTGYLSDDELAARLLAADVPVAPNRRVTASGSINTWIAHGRRPLVPDSLYAREVSADRPGTVSMYDPDDPGALKAAVAAAIDEPDSTWLAAGLDRGPTLEHVVAIYRDHLAACAPASPLEVSGGWTVPGNRWDLLAAHPVTPATVSVIIPYFDAQPQLDRTLAALAKQTHPPDRLEVVVADDGSPEPPDLRRAGELRARVVHQDDHGFRAAAARNLGASAASGDVLIFLDADTVPEPDFVARLTRLPSLCPDAVTVGRRRHADFATEPPTAIAEPAWLRAAYAASSNLLEADARSYRYVISAVLAMRHSLFDELTGFDERFVGYGGEDWELAHRAWVAGAVFAHVPDAIAVHDGPDWAGRADGARPGAKDDETAALAVLLPDPVARGSGQWVPYPAVVLRVGRSSAVDLLATARSAFSSGADVGIWADEVSGARAELVLLDTRLHVGPVAADVLARARWTVDVTAAGAVDLARIQDLCLAADRSGEIVSPGVRVRSTHARNRAARWWPDDVDARSALLFGRHDRSSPPAGTAGDLAETLRRC